MGYLMSKPFLLNRSSVTIKLIACGGKGIRTFPKDINPKVNIIGRQEFELAYDKIAVRHVSHHATRTPTGNCIITVTHLIFPYRIILILVRSATEGCIL